MSTEGKSKRRATARLPEDLWRRIIQESFAMEEASSPDSGILALPLSLTCKAFLCHVRDLRKTLRTRLIHHDGTGAVRSRWLLWMWYLLREDNVEKGGV